MQIFSAVPANTSLALDMPTGRVDAIPSGVTGRPLRYATPAPVSELLSRCQHFKSGWSQGRDPVLTAWLLPLAAYRASKGIIDPALGALLGEVAFARTSYRRSDDLLALGRKIHPSLGLREENVFSGALSASDAKHIYAPHETLPGLMDDLSQVLRKPPPSIDPVVFAAVVAMYCSCAHPFMDGNGRWTRVVALEAGAAAGSSEAGVAVGVCLAMFYADLAGHIWPASFSGGLRPYLELVSAFVNALATGVKASPERAVVDQLLAALRKSASSRSTYEKTIIQIFTTNTIDRQLLRAAFGLSERAANGLLSQVGNIYHSAHVSFENDGPALIPTIWKLALDAKENVMENPS